MLKGIKFNQQKPEIQQAELDLLLLNPDTKYIPQKKWKKEVPEKVYEQPIKKTIEAKQLKNIAQEIWDNFLTNDVKKCAQQCHKLIKIQDEYFKEAFPQNNINENSNIIHKDFMNPDEENFEGEIEKFNKISKSTNFQGLQSDIKKNLKNSKLEEKKQDYNYDKMTINFMNKYKNIMNSEDLYDLMDDNPEKKKENKKDKKYMEKQKHNDKNKEKSFKRRTDRILSSCKYCIANGFIDNEQIIKMGSYCALIFPKLKRYKENYFHIVTLEHYSSSLEVEDEIYDEIILLKKSLITLFKKFELSMIFFETAINLKTVPHCIIEALAIPSKLMSDAQMFFKKAILEMESEWAVHKKIIEIINEKGGIRKQIPKNFPFFYVDFNHVKGYAHVVEKEQNFDKLMHHEIMCSVLEIEKNDVLKGIHMEKQELEELKSKILSLWQMENLQEPNIN